MREGDTQTGDQEKAQSLGAQPDGSGIPLCPGWDLVMAGRAGQAGAAAAVSCFREELLRRFPHWLLERAAWPEWQGTSPSGRRGSGRGASAGAQGTGHPAVPWAEEAVDLRTQAQAEHTDRAAAFIAQAEHADRAAAFMAQAEHAVCVAASLGPAAHCLGKGGILNGLWEMAEAGGVGLEADLRRIPIRQETVEICEYFDLNPYYLDSAGAVLFGTPRGEALVSLLAGEQIPAAVIGWTTGGKDRILHSRGVRRCLNRPQPDEWERLAALRGRESGVWPWDRYRAGF